MPKGTPVPRFHRSPKLAKAWLRGGPELEDVSGLMYEPWRNNARVIAATTSLSRPRAQTGIPSNMFPKLVLFDLTHLSTARTWRPR